MAPATPVAASGSLAGASRGSSSTCCSVQQPCRSDLWLRQRLLPRPATLQERPVAPAPPVAASGSLSRASCGSTSAPVAAPGPGFVTLNRYQDRSRARFVTLNRYQDRSGARFVTLNRYQDRSGAGFVTLNRYQDRSGAGFVTLNSYQDRSGAGFVTLSRYHGPLQGPGTFLGRSCDVETSTRIVPGEDL